MNITNRVDALETALARSARNYKRYMALKAAWIRAQAVEISRFVKEHGELLDRPAEESKAA
jgi:hypothetical protein